MKPSQKIKNPQTESIRHHHRNRRNPYFVIRRTLCEVSTVRHRPIASYFPRIIMLTQNVPS